MWACAVGSKMSYGKVCDYSPPEWAAGLKIVPKSRIPLIMAPTPVHEWYIPGTPSPFTILVKRDDLTGCTTSGNKIRKAEFILADAVEKGSKCIVTFGGIKSNHARTMALAARELGLNTILFILTPPTPGDPAEMVGCRGNMMLNRLSGAEVITCPEREGSTHSDDVIRVSRLMEDYVDKLKQLDRKPYLVPVGGTCPLGEWGYIHTWEELRGQGALDNIDDIVLASGSGGTAAGLAVANYLTGSKVKIHAVVVATMADHLYNVIGQSIAQLGLEGVEPCDLIDLIDGYLLGGFGHVTQELKELVVSVASETGIILDPIYTGKAILGMLSEMKINPHRFHGNRVLFINTGGIFNTFNGIIDDVVQTAPTSTHIHGYTEP